MVEISKSGSGEGPGGAIPRGYSTGASHRPHAPSARGGARPVGSPSGPFEHAEGPAADHEASRVSLGARLGETDTPPLSAAR